ncbi:thymidine phosphorylase family protein [Rhodanobacter sp. T12-5]|uniref:thymidine phosphorylase family protein n=1 Tax=Rhodanobacter sp. T12-5 TaxID=2024611 RepID=UPI0011EE6500|nr:thymidine phosphorylase family protein [Rhodanobacter sp. T12-5]KAA0068348.1 thymidine phosphorylase family protein [Rhodanobacter sp. T12-5]
MSAETTGFETFPRPRLEPGHLRRLGIDTGHELVVYLNRDSPICRSEGFGAHSRLELRVGTQRVLATLNIVQDGLLGADEAGLSESAWLAVQPGADERVIIAHPPSVDSLASVRAKIYGRELDGSALHGIIQDIVGNRYSSIEMAAFITAAGGNRLSLAEVVALTKAMVQTGAQLRWRQPLVVDKHCIGGLAGNRTTPIVVAIAAELGLTIPKTSSRAITSAAGTADTMAMLAPVDLDEAQIRRVVETCGGCIAWGGAMNLAPADDRLIRIERALDIDSAGQLVASVLSKKIAAGSTHVVIDVPVGPTAKVRDHAEAESLAALLQQVAAAFGLQLRVLLSDGSQPVGRGIGPALEAHDVLAVLRNEPHAPPDLRAHALAIAAAVLELAGVADADASLAMATACLETGRAWQRFQSICAAQGGMRTPGKAAYQQAVPAAQPGHVTAIDNRRLSRVAKLAGAPAAPLAGLTLDAHLGETVAAGQALFTLHAQSPGELAYAMEYVSRHPCIVCVEASA